VIMSAFNGREEHIRVVVDGDDDGSSPQGHDDDDAARRAADAAEADLRQAQRERTHWRKVLAQSRAENAMVRVEQKKAEADTAAQEFQHASDYGDPAAAAEANRRMMRAEAERVRAEAEADAARGQFQSVPTHADPVDDMLARCTPQTAEWFRKHPDLARDAATGGPMARKLDAAHATAIEKGLQPDTAGYWEHANRYLGLQDGSGSRRSHNVPERPASFNPHDANTHVFNNGKTVFLSAGEAKSATDGTLLWNVGPNRGKPIGIEEASRRKRAMIAEGRYRQLD